MESSLENSYKGSPKNVIDSANKLADLLLIFFSPMTMMLTTLHETISGFSGS